MSSNNIYSSEKTLPYVYKLTHKETNHFYFGVRHANKVPSTQDLGTHYFTSSKYVKELGFNNFESEILAEFFNKEDAIDFEKSLIEMCWGQDGILNKNIGGKYFSYGLNHTEETKLKMSKTRKGKPRPEFSEEWKQNMSKSRLGNKTGPRSKEYCDKLSKIKTGVKLGPLTEEHKNKLSIAGKGRIKTEEECKRISEGKKGIKTGPWTEERKKKFSEQMKKRKEISSPSLNDK